MLRVWNKTIDYVDLAVTLVAERLSMRCPVATSGDYGKTLAIRNPLPAKH